MFERMRFSRLRRSRLTLAVVATVWLPYMSVCCIAAPLGGAEGSSACCPMLAGPMQHSAQADSHDSHAVGHSGSHGVELTHADASSADDQMPARTCCELTGKFRVTVSKNIDLDAPTGVVTVSLIQCELADCRAEKVTREPVANLALSPPLYLTNASFLI